MRWHGPGGTPLHQLEASSTPLADEAHFQRTADELDVCIDELLAWHRVMSAAASWRPGQDRPHQPERAARGTQRAGVTKG